MRQIQFLFLIASAFAANAQTVSFLPPVSVAGFSAGLSGQASICSPCIAVADVNNDGIPDVVFSAFAGLPAGGVLLGKGDGTFRAGPSFDISRLGRDTPVAVGDFNGDGKADYFFGGTFYTGTGDDGAYHSSPNDPEGPRSVGGCQTLPLVLADLNRDGKSDAICGSAVLLSAGDGTFTPVAAQLTGTFVLTGDFNKDGIPDVLTTQGPGFLAVALGNGDGSFRTAVPLSTGIDPNSVTAGDFNGDGKVDIAGARADSSGIAVVPGNGDGTFGSPVITPGVPGTVFAAADFNGDGKLDLLAGEAILTGNGDGTFRFPLYVGLSSEIPVSHGISVVADLNGDKLPDVISGYVTREQGSSAGKTGPRVFVNLNDSPGDGFTVTGISAATGTLPVAPGSFVSAYGVNLAPSTLTVLGGIRLHIRDWDAGTDSLATVLYASPTQINFLMPRVGSFAFVDIERFGSPYVPKGMGVPVASVAPGLFTIGAGLAAATTASGPTFTCLGPICSAAPINVSSGNTYLSLYGTGFAATAMNNVTCTLAGKTLPVSYAGPQLQIAGLDQINVLLPASLAGTGATSISCSFGPGLVTNGVGLSIR